MPSRNGAFIPAYQEIDYETGEAMFALAHEDFEAIRQGYGCSYCLADYHGIHLQKCPQCGNDTLRVVPQWWTTRSAV